MNVNSQEKMQHLNVLLNAARRHLSDADHDRVADFISRANRFYAEGHYIDATICIDHVVSFLKYFIEYDLVRKGAENE